MKNAFSVLAVLMMVGAPALADVNTVCLGSGHRIDIVHVLGTVGSVSDKALLNGHETKSVFQGQTGDILAFSLQTSAHVLSFDYNQMEATAHLTGQGLDVSMFCSRY